MSKRRTMAEGQHLLPEFEGLMRYAFAAPVRVTRGLHYAWHPIPGGLGLFQQMAPAKNTRRARRRARGRRVLVSRALQSGSEWAGQALKALDRAGASTVIPVRW